ncbi:MAG: ankyrin repeat domain-containing protein [Anaerovoracaceae bacterium]
MVGIRHKKNRVLGIVAIGVLLMLLAIIMSLILLKKPYEQARWSNQLVKEIQKKDYNSVDRLLEVKGMDINKEGGANFPLYFLPEYDKETPLYAACWSGNYQFVKKVINYGADVTKDERVVLVTLEQYDKEDFEIVKLLLRQGASLDSDDVLVADKAMLLVVRMRPYNGSEYSKKIATDIVGIYGLLKKNGAEELLSKDEKNSILSEVATVGNIELVKYILNEGVNVNTVDRNGRTALINISYVEYSPNDKKIAQILLNGGADKKLKDNNGKTAFDYAKENSKESLARMVAP